jgi:hypothetical protein
MGFFRGEYQMIRILFIAALHAFENFRLAINCFDFLERKVFEEKYYFASLFDDNNKTKKGVWLGGEKTLSKEVEWVRDSIASSASSVEVIVHVYKCPFRCAFSYTCIKIFVDAVSPFPA